MLQVVVTTPCDYKLVEYIHQIIAVISMKGIIGDKKNETQFIFSIIQITFHMGYANISKFCMREVRNVTRIWRAQWLFHTR